MLTHHNIVCNILQMYDGSYPHGMFDNVLFLLPMFHVYGVAYIGLMHLLHGATAVSLPSFDPITFLTAIQEYKVNFSQQYTVQYSTETQIKIQRTHSSFIQSIFASQIQATPSPHPIRLSGYQSLQKWLL